MVLLLTTVALAVTFSASSAPAAARARVTCGVKALTFLFWPDGHNAIPSINFPSFPFPHMEVYKPGAEIGVDGEFNDHTVPVTELAKAVEDAALESLFVIQRTHLTVSRRELLEQEGHEMDASLLDPFVVLGAAAAVTSRIKLGTGACYVAVYDPLILARQVATIDQISGGRFLFGITPGWDELEIRNHGIDPPLRWRVTREKVLALKALWTEPEAEFHGRFVDFEPVLLGLKPVQEPRPPILVGSHGPHGWRVRRSMAMSGSRS